MLGARDKEDTSMNMTIEEMREFYGRRYKKIIDALEEIGVEQVSVAIQYGKHLQFACYPLKDDKYKYHLWMNIGINNKYNATYGSEYSWIGRIHQHHYDTQDEAARYIRIIGGKEREPRYYIGDDRKYTH